MHLEELCDSKNPILVNVVGPGNLVWPNYDYKDLIVANGMWLDNLV